MYCPICKAYTAHLVRPPNQLPMYKCKEHYSRDSEGPYVQEMFTFGKVLVFRRSSPDEDRDFTQFRIEDGPDLEFVREYLANNDIIQKAERYSKALCMK